MVLLTPAQLSARSGLSVPTLHFYEQRGLIVSIRTSGNQRRYRLETLRRLAFIRAAQRVGLPLTRVREALATLPGDRTPTAADWARLSDHWRQDLDRQIETLLRLRDDLSGCIQCGCLSLDRCQLVNPGDRFGVAHPGHNALLGE